MHRYGDVPRRETGIFRLLRQGRRGALACPSTAACRAPAFCDPAARRRRPWRTGAWTWLSATTVTNPAASMTSPSTPTSPATSTRRATLCASPPAPPRTWGTGLRSPTLSFLDPLRARACASRRRISALCSWGADNVTDWGHEVGQVIRIQQDHLPFWSFPALGAGASLCSVSGGSDPRFPRRRQGLRSGSEGGHRVHGRPGNGWGSGGMVSLRALRHTRTHTHPPMRSRATTPAATDGWTQTSWRRRSP